jgi:hypothetical protein
MLMLLGFVSNGHLAGIVNQEDFKAGPDYKETPSL